MLIEFTISIEVEGDEYPSDELDQMLSDMEEIVGKSEFTLNDSEWSEI